MTDLDDKEKADVPERAGPGKAPEVRDAEVRDAETQDAEVRDAEVRDAEVHDLDAEGPEISNPAERDRLLAATVAHATAQDAQYSMVPTDPRALAQWWKWLLASALVVAALLSLSFPPTWMAAPPRPALTVEDALRGLHATLFLQAAEIDVFRLREGRLPASLAELERTFPGIRYVRSSSRAYQLVAPVPGSPRSVLVWDSANPPAERLSLGRRWVQRPFFP